MEVAKGKIVQGEEDEEDDIVPQNAVRAEDKSMDADVTSNVPYPHGGVPLQPPPSISVADEQIYKLVTNGMSSSVVGCFKWTANKAKIVSNEITQTANIIQVCLTCTMSINNNNFII